jgi:hypothetical protein
VILSAVKSEERRALDVRDALYAICSTGKGRCWYCDQSLPRLEEALDHGWDVQRVEGARVATIIIVCPLCQLKPDELVAKQSTVAARA